MNFEPGERDAAQAYLDDRERVTKVKKQLTKLNRQLREAHKAYDVEHGRYLKGIAVCLEALDLQDRAKGMIYEAGVRALAEAKKKHANGSAIQREATHAKWGLARAIKALTKEIVEVRRQLNHTPAKGAPAPRADLSHLLE